MAGDRFNPILVREIRQMMRSRLVGLGLLLFMLSAACFTGFVLLAYRARVGIVPDNEFGDALILGLGGITALTTLLVVLVRSSWKMGTDRFKDELLLATLLTPGRQIRGRLLCGLVLSLFFFGMAVPFLSVALFFPGTKLWLYLLVIPLPLFVIQYVNIVVVAVFSPVRSPFQLFFYALLFLVLIACAAVSGLYAYRVIFEARAYWQYSLLFSGVTTYGILQAMEREYSIAAQFLVAFLLIPPTAYFVACCNMSSVSSNRLRPIRLWLSFVIVATFVLALVDYQIHDIHFSDHYRSRKGLYLIRPWANLATTILSVMLVFAVCERETWEGRLRRTIPRSKFRRMLAFPFFTGSINALVWVFLWTFLFAIGFSLFLIYSEQISSRRSVGFEAFWLFRCMIFLMLVFNYSMTAFFLWKKYLQRRVAREMIWTLTLGLIIAASLPGILLTMEYGSATFEIGKGLVHLGNPLFVLLDDYFDIFQCVFAFLWFAAIMFFAYPWLKSRFLDFAPEPFTDLGMKNGQ